MNIKFLVEQIYGKNDDKKLWAFANLIFFSDALNDGNIKNIAPTSEQLNQILLNNINLEDLVEKLNNNIYKKYRTEERTEINECQYLSLNKEILLECFEILGFIDDILPQKNYYDYVCIFGTTGIGIKWRFENLRKYISDNNLKFKKIILLGSHRKLWLDHDCDNALNLGDSAAIKLLHKQIKANNDFSNINEIELIEKIHFLKNQYLNQGLSYARKQIYQYFENEYKIQIPTESDMMKTIFERRYGEIATDYILIDATLKEDGSRPTTIDNVEKLLNSKISKGSFLFWSHQPFISCQNMAVEKVFKRFKKKYPQKNFSFETCGLKGEEQSIALLFTEFVSKLNRYLAKSKI
jgi:hypothetical protein